MHEAAVTALPRLGLIGGIGMTEVHVYAQRAAPDGSFSGCPHVHAVNDEAYYVLTGSGAAEFHDLQNGYRKVPLAAGDYVQFPPLVLHRLISNGDLVILGIMANAGLAERGEARIYFGKTVDESPGAYDRAAQLPSIDPLPAALRRRDAAVAAYQALLQLWTADRPAYFAELARFFDTHCEQMSRSADPLRGAVMQGPLARAEDAISLIDRLPAGRAECQPPVVRNGRGDDSSFGMCGVLRPILSMKKID